MSDQENQEKKAKFSLKGKLKTYFFTGILVTAPAGISIYLAILLISFLDKVTRNLIPKEFALEYYIPGLGILFCISLLIIIGMFAAGFVGRFFMRLGEKLLNKMPIISGVYSALKQILETILARKSNAFRKVVLIEYPRKNIWAMGFITSETKGEVAKSIGDDEPLVNIFLPTTPNPTSGFLLFVPKKDVKTLNMSVEEGIKLVISGGIVTPP